MREHQDRETYDPGHAYEDYLDRVDAAYEEFKPVAQCRRCHEPTERPVDDNGLCVVCQDECSGPFEVKEINRQIEFTTGPPHTAVADLRPDLLDQPLFYAEIIFNPATKQFYYLVLHTESQGNGWYGKNHPTKEEAIEDAKARIIKEMIEEGD